MATYECSIRGIIKGVEEKDAFVRRLYGVCGNDSMIDLFEHEIVFMPAVQTPVGPARNDDVILRLQSRITSEQDKSLKNRQWYLCMQGHPEPQRGRSVTVRPHVKVQLNGDVFRFMASLGYRYSFELVRKGHLFAYEKMFRFTVSQIYKLKSKVEVSSAVLMDGEQDLWIVEATSIPVPQEQVNQMAEQLNQFKILFPGIWESVDTRALQNRVHY